MIKDLDDQILDDEFDRESQSLETVEDVLTSRLRELRRGQIVDLPRWAQ